MRGHSLPARSLRSQQASLRTFSDGTRCRLAKQLIARMLLAIRRSIFGVEPIFLSAFREGRSERTGLVDEVAQGLAGEEAAAIVEDDLVAPVVEIGAVARGMRRQQHARQGPQLVVGGQRLLLEDVETGTGDLTRPY